MTRPSVRGRKTLLLITTTACEAAASALRHRYCCGFFSGKHKRFGKSTRSGKRKPREHKEENSPIPCLVPDLQKGNEKEPETLNNICTATLEQANI